MNTNQLAEYYGVVYKDHNNVECKITFKYWYECQAFADSQGFRFIRFEHTYNKVNCTCDGTSQKQMECATHGISAQLNRSQME